MVKLKLAEKNIKYAEVVKCLKWFSREKNGVSACPTLKEWGILCINEEPDSQSEILNRCTVGTFSENASNRTNTSEIGRWVCNIWKQTHGLNEYEMGNSNFLFQSAFKLTTE